MGSHGDLSRLFNVKYVKGFIQISYRCRTHVVHQPTNSIQISNTSLQLSCKMCTRLLHKIVHQPTTCIHTSTHFARVVLSEIQHASVCPRQNPENGFPWQACLHSAQKVRCLKTASPGRGASTARKKLRRHGPRIIQIKN